jgi:hypothetical protein
MASILTPDRKTNMYALVTVGLLVTAIIIWAGIELRNYAFDDAYITFRHSRNLINNRGFAFNPGDRLLSTTAPLHGLTLALLALLRLGEIPQLAILLSSIAMLALCFAVVTAMRQEGMLFAGLAAVLFLAGQHWLYRFYSLETIVLLALNVTVMLLTIQERWVWSGIVAGLALVTRPDAAVMVSTVVLYMLLTRQKISDILKFSLTCAIVALPWFVFATVHYGSPLPNTLAAKTGFGRRFLTYIETMWPKILSTLTSNKYASIAIAGLAIIGIITAISRRSRILILPSWAALHIVGYSLLRLGFAYAWYYAPIILVTVVMSCIGIQGIIDGAYALARRKLPERAARFTKQALLVTALVVASLLLAFSLSEAVAFVTSHETDYYGGARDQVYRQVALWLRENTQLTDTVAVAEVGTIGYFSDRYIIDMLGLVTYELRNLPQNRTWAEAIASTEPEYVIAISGIPPDPNLTGLENYYIVQRFPKNESNLFRDIVIYQRDTNSP